jgi:phosphoribosylaminoimidazolecarboxamide formyltransferase/IMP cyclohydrolase
MSDKKRLALISVSDKTGIAEFASGLKRLGFEIVSTGGTAEALKKKKIKVIGVAELTGFPKMLEGRVKSLHPAIFSGILADRSKAAHMKDLKNFKLRAIDVVVCNLYPFEEVISRPKFTHEEAIENIDIGGPSMVRAAAKNYKDVAVIVDPADYNNVLAELRKKGGKLSIQTKETLAAKAFAHTRRYDTLISLYFKSRSKPEGETVFEKEIDLFLEKIQDLRYGENPHQKAAFYREKGSTVLGITSARQLFGKELSFNNIADLDAAWKVVTNFSDPAAAVIKHMNPCGVAVAPDINTAFKKAYGADPLSAFGGIVALNRELDKLTAEQMEPLFLEAVIAPSYSNSALQFLKKVKKNLRIMEMPLDQAQRKSTELEFKRASGGFLVQEEDILKTTSSDLKVVTKKQPSLLEIRDLLFAFGVVKNVKSNAIVIAKNGRTLGIGAGQMSRVDSTEIALKKSGLHAKGAVLASDAFFPFRDSIEHAAKAGISAIIQPGGSIRDEEVIQAANEHSMAMVFTGKRHFKH